ncbi:hypothetical protein LLS1_06960 [Leifsonia sp. LS1]|uniref:cupin domain-containing protein n=1 Tax=Leifsonia sp. LS1 TaxID=2828483 RepID=UPI001CFC4FBB|nr:cupin domain-containing protein [Leifsonia sp. LS1]GIT79027.1 hypothetical protein LLS1_06960 [Leifsonia sp. LS1]
MTHPTFPGATGVSRLDVYDSLAPDGLVGGTPHVHLVSTEAYVVTAGRGRLMTIDGTGLRETPLAEGAVVWFTPGTIHRAVNEGGLRVVVLMSNAGLPEAGDAVMTFPPEVLADPVTYADAASLGDGDDESRAAQAIRRRDLAVAGFSILRDAAEAGDPAPLAAFYAAAARLVRGRAHDWSALIERGPLAQANRSLERVRALADGLVPSYDDATVRTAPPSPGARGFGMCGRLRTYDLRGGPRPR